MEKNSSKRKTERTTKADRNLPSIKLQLRFFWGLLWCGTHWIEDTLAQNLVQTAQDNDLRHKAKELCAALKLNPVDSAIQSLLCKNSDFIFITSEGTRLSNHEASKCKCLENGLDLIIGVDSSTNISEDDFNVNKKFVAKLIEAVDQVANKKLAVGLIQFSDIVNEEFKLSQDINTASMDSTIISQKGQASRPAIGNALEYIQKNMVGIMNGDRVDVLNLIVIITASPSFDDSLPPAISLRQKGNHIVFIGVNQGINTGPALQLQKLVGVNNADNRLFLLNGFNALDNTLVKNIVKVSTSCPQCMKPMHALNDFLNDGETITCDVDSLSALILIDTQVRGTVTGSLHTQVYANKTCIPKTAIRQGVYTAIWRRPRLIASSFCLSDLQISAETNISPDLERERLDLEGKVADVCGSLTGKITSVPFCSNQPFVLTDNHGNIRKSIYHPDECVCYPNGIDLVFVVDGSTAMTSADFTKIQGMMSAIVTKYNSTVPMLRVGLLFYADQVKSAFRLFTFAESPESIVHEINQLTYNPMDGSNLGKALQFVNTDFLTKNNGDRLESPNLVMIIAGSVSKDNPSPAAQILRSKDPADKIVVITFGADVDSTQFLDVTGGETGSLMRAEAFPPSGVLSLLECAICPDPFTYLSELRNNYELECRAQNTEISIGDANQVMGFISGTLKLKIKGNEAISVPVMFGAFLMQENCKFCVSGVQFSFAEPKNAGLRVEESHLTLKAGDFCHKLNTRELRQTIQVCENDFGFTFIDKTGQVLSTRNPVTDCNLILEGLDLILLVAGYEDEIRISAVTDFLEQLIKAAANKAGVLRVAYISYTDAFDTGFLLNEFTGTDSLELIIIEIVLSLPEAGDSDLAEALQFVSNNLLGLENGDRPESPNLIVVVTDQLSMNDPSDIANELTANGNTIVAVAVGSDTELENELVKVVSAPGNLFLAEDFIDLAADSTRVQTIASILDSCDPVERLRLLGNANNIGCSVENVTALQASGQELTGIAEGFLEMSAISTPDLVQCGAYTARWSMLENTFDEIFPTEQEYCLSSLHISLTTFDTPVTDDVICSVPNFP